MHLATLMLLGSGELGREFAIAAKRLGCRVIACDRYPRAPAMQCADANEVFSMLDGAARLKDLFAEAKSIGAQNPAVAAIVGGSYVLFADRLPCHEDDDCGDDQLCTTTEFAGEAVDEGLAGDGVPVRNGDGLDLIQGGGQFAGLGGVQADRLDGARGARD